MKLVIDIPDETYETIKNAEPLKWDCPIESAYNAIKNGIPQKTGHWIDDKCSACGKGIEDLIESSEWYQNENPKYCPFCGIKIHPYKDRK